MLHYIARRLIHIILMSVVLATLVFLLFQILPTDPAALTCGRTCTPTSISQNRIRLGYDQPVWQQYQEFWQGIFKGRTFGSGAASFSCPAPCLGYSFTQHAEVTDLISKRLPITLIVIGGALLLWLTFGILTGILTAVKNGRGSRILQITAVISYSLPLFFIGIILRQLVFFKFHLMAYPRYHPLAENPGTYFLVFLLPWLTLAIGYAGLYARITRQQLLLNLQQPYIKTARAQGIPERVVLRKFALRGALTPLLTLTGMDIGGLLGGAIIVEQIFGIPGFGKLALSAVINADLPLIMGTVLVSGVLILLCNLIVDLLYTWCDPRVRLG